MMRHGVCALHDTSITYQALQRTVAAQARLLVLLTIFWLYLLKKILSIKKSHNVGQESKGGKGQCWPCPEHVNSGISPEGCITSSDGVFTKRLACRDSAFRPQSDLGQAAEKLALWRSTVLPAPLASESAPSVLRRALPLPWAACRTQRPCSFWERYYHQNWA